LNTSDIIAIGSVLIAGLALLQSWRASRDAANATRENNALMKKQVAIQDRLTQIEQSREQAKIIQSLKADLRAEIRQVKQSTWRLFVTNGGRGTARNVRVMLDGKPLLEHDVIPGGQEEVKIIGPKSEISCCMAMSYSCSPPFDFDVTWEDDTGQQGLYRTTLTF